MNKSPLISIIVPVYNVEKYVLKCLKSLVNQSYDNIEILVVDDGSTDKSGKICDEFALKDKRIRVFHKKNGGLSSARNFGIKKAKGEYICLVDSDDYVRKEFVEKMLEAAKEKNAEIVVCGYDTGMPKTESLSGKEAAIRLLVKQQNVDVVAWNKMYQKKLFDDILYPEGQNYEDTLTTYKLLAEAKKVMYIAEPLYVYVERGGSITKSDKKEEKLMAREKAAEEAVEYFKKNKELKKAAEIALLTAKFAYIDFAENKVIDKSYGEMAMEWIKENAKKYNDNPFLTTKLKMYLKMICFGTGTSYRLFRKIKHE